MSKSYTQPLECPPAEAIGKREAKVEAERRRRGERALEPFFVWLALNYSLIRANERIDHSQHFIEIVPNLVFDLSASSS